MDFNVGDELNHKKQCYKTTIKGIHKENGQLWFTLEDYVMCEYQTLLQQYEKTGRRFLIKHGRNYKKVIEVNNMTIQAIETRYKGYRFRSRLEAKWAVFLDTLGVRWEYEKEGYKLSDGSFYLPDFWLPDNELWLEIKSENPDAEGLKKFYTFTHDSMPALLAFGMPNDNLMELHCWDSGESSIGWGSWHVNIFRVKENRLHFFVKGSLKYNNERTFFSDDSYENTIDVLFGPKRFYLPSITNAMNAARSARFEHGE